VHLANNVFKFVLLKKMARWSVVLRFGVTAALAAIAGAAALVIVAELPPLTRYEAFGRDFEILPLKLVIGVLIGTFALLELSKRFAKLAVPSRYIPVGGLLSGFFGGLSGNQGAMRSAFLIKAGLSKEEFVATGVVCAVIVDITRIFVYGASTLATDFSALPMEHAPLVISASIAAFAGALIGRKLLTRITLTTVQRIVAISMFTVGAGLISGIL